jgi:hypothetical protein
MSQRDEFHKQVDRLVASSVLHGSESLCKLLQYLAKHALEHPSVPLKEYQIATEVYGRRADFDPQSDSTIRVQAGRLRLKLAEYYAGEGVADPVLVKLPKGTYVLSFEERVIEPQPVLMPLLPEEVARRPRHEVMLSHWQIAVLVLSIGLVISLLTLGNLLWTRKLPDAALAAPGAPGTAAMRAFWKPFISSPEQPWVIFSNAAFVGRPETGMRYFNVRDAKASVHDHYTGVGEVLAIHELDQVFEGMGQRLRVKRGSLFTLDDAKNNDLIFVGSPSENLSLLDIPGTQEFVFHRVESGPRQGDLAIVSRHPRPGEASTFLASPSNAALTEDYSVVGLVPGLDPAHFIMILAGTTTFGTQGAVEFVSRQDSVEHLLTRLPAAKNGQEQPFEALVRVKIARGVPVETELVAVRTR